MDTGTHIVMGIALGGLATLDPAVSQTPAMQHAIMAGTIIGSNAPDFDTILKLRNNAVYIRHHRGLSHSIPAIFLWPILISLAIYMTVPTLNFWHLWLWTFLAVFLHVVVDIFNAYGTQALRPFSHRWIALGIINTFDPFIFAVHLFAIGLWLLGFPPAPVFLPMYLLVIAYYGWRISVYKILIKRVKDEIAEDAHVIASPTIQWNKWLLAIKTEEKFYVARAKKTEITILDEYTRKPLPDTAVIQAAKRDKNVAAFLSFSPIYRWEIKETNIGYDVRFIDLRYRSRGHYPFVAVVKLNNKLDVVNSYTGWVYNKERLEKKLDPVNNF